MNLSIREKATRNKTERARERRDRSIIHIKANPIYTLGKNTRRGSFLTLRRFFVHLIDYGQ